MSGSQRRPGDIFIPGWIAGRDAAIDVTVVTPVQVSFVEKAAEIPLYAAKEAHQRKMAKNYEDLKTEGVEFITVALETFGAWHPEARSHATRLFY